MIAALQILFALSVIILIILFVFQPKRKPAFELPENYQELLNDYVRFYTQLDEEGKKYFDERLVKFLSSIKITGSNAEVEDLDQMLIGAAAIIPVFYIKDWEYINLREVLLYPGSFNSDFEQQGTERNYSGLMGNAHLENVVILSKWELRQSFINAASHRNVAIHEFVHLIDKMDGTMDGVPELLLERKYVTQWKELMEQTMNGIRNGSLNIDIYAATSPVECFAVLSEYFFQQPQTFQTYHPQLYALMQKIFRKS
jgi:Mlc titration factor MtfA (ptsG expression regulator)